MCLYICVYIYICIYIYIDACWTFHRNSMQFLSIHHFLPLHFKPPSFEMQFLLFFGASYITPQKTSPFVLEGVTLQVDGRCIRRSSWNLWSDSWVVSIPWSPEDYPWQLTALPSFSSVITGGQKRRGDPKETRGGFGESRFFGFKVMEKV